MLDIKFIKENAVLVREAARKKRINFNLDELLAVEEDRLKRLSEVEMLRGKQNAANAGIANAVGEEREKLLSEMKAVKEELQKGEASLADIMKRWQLLMLAVPNVPDMSVPEGEDDNANQEVRKWGELPRFDFTPKDHVELMSALGMVDFERGVKTSGFRGYFLKNDGAMLSLAIWNYTLKQLIGKGFTPMLTPSLVRKEAFMGTGYLPQAEEDLYKTQDDLYLSGTAEVPTMGYHMNEILDKNKLPIKFASFSPCFRREIGAHGKDTKGIIRVHEFFKVEQVMLIEASHEESVRYHEEITKNAEEFVQALGLPYRVVVNCGGDLGQGQVKKYDIEAWVPSENKYRETHSSSYFHDFQTRRLNIRYKDSDGKLHLTHSLNNTAMATPRLLVAIVENYQQADGTIKIPEVLVPYMGKEKIG